MTDLKKMMEIADQHPPTTEERIAALEAAALALTDTFNTVFARLEALEAKPKGNKQGYPSTGVVWDGQVQLMAKAYGYGNAEIESMQEAMDIYFLALVGTSKARVSSDWQLNARTWIKNDAKRHGRERQDGPGSTEGSDVQQSFQQKGLAALRRILPGATAEQIEAIWYDKGLRLVPSQIDVAANQMGMYWQEHRSDVVRAAARHGIPAGAFSWPAV